MLKWVLDLCLGGKVARETDKYLRQLEEGPERSAQQGTTDLLQQLRRSDKVVRFGQTTWGAPVDIPVEELIKAQSLITGGTGAGKTGSALISFRHYSTTNGRLPW